MRLLIDTQILIWSAEDAERVPKAARAMIEEAEVRAFSVASVWEMAIKAPLKRTGFSTVPARLRDGLLRGGYVEVEVTAHHALAVADLPLIHGDPFDRLLVAQARVEGHTLLTADRTLAAYGDPVRLA